MTSKELNNAKEKVKKLNPIVHAITNPISINQCANAILATGARPIMAEHPYEVQEITLSADSLVLNLGNITDTRIEAMKLSLEIANRRNIPVVVDAVGVACSKLRRNLVIELLGKNTCTIVKGNYSEINALYDLNYKCCGVDADKFLTCDKVTEVAAKLAKKTNAVVLASGKTDIITDGKQIVYIKNGTPQLASVTGTGCILGMLCGCFLVVSDRMTAATLACAVLGICGELSETNKGSGSFMANLLDNLSTLSNEDLKKYLKMEVRRIESI